MAKGGSRRIHGVARDAVVPYFPIALESIQRLNPFASLHD